MSAVAHAPDCDRRAGRVCNPALRIWSLWFAGRVEETAFVRGEVARRVLASNPEAVALVRAEALEHHRVEGIQVIIEPGLSAVTDPLRAKAVLDLSVCWFVRFPVDDGRVATSVHMHVANDRGSIRLTR